MKVFFYSVEEDSHTLQVVSHNRSSQWELGLRLRETLREDAQ